MKKRIKKNAPKSFKDMEELGRKCGVQVINMAEDGVRAVGFSGRRHGQAQATPKLPPQNVPDGGRKRNRV